MLIISKIRLFIPNFLALISIFLICLPVRIVGFNNFFPALDIMVIYYWCVSKPKLMGYGSLFLLGMYKDLIMGIPVGINAFINMVLRMLILQKGKNLKPSFIVFWHGFAIILLIWLAIQTLVFAIITGHSVNINVVLIQFVLSLLIYPVAHSFFNLIYVILPKSILNG